MRPPDTQCKGPWPANTAKDHVIYYDQWVEPGQLRQVSGKSVTALIIGPTDDQDEHQHDRTIKWLVLINDRLMTEHLSTIGEWWLVYPTPSEA